MLIFSVDVICNVELSSSFYKVFVLHQRAEDNETVNTKSEQCNCDVSKIFPHRRKKCTAVEKGKATASPRTIFARAVESDAKSNRSDPKRLRARRNRVSTASGSTVEAPQNEVNFQNTYLLKLMC